MSNGYEKDLAIGSLVADLGNRSLTAVSKAVGCCFRKVKKCYDEYVNGKQLFLEFKGRKKITEKYTHLKDDISEEKFKVLIDDAKESIEIRKKLLKERNINVTDKIIREIYRKKLFNDLYGALEERRSSLIEKVNCYEEKSDELDEICDFYDGSLSFPNWLEEKKRDMRYDLNDARKQLECVNSQIQYVLKKGKRYICGNRWLEDYVLISDEYRCI